MPRPLQVNLWPFDVESGVRVTCDVGYLCANFSLPRPFCSRIRPDVRDRQTSDRRQTSDAHHRLMPPPYGGGVITSVQCRVVQCQAWEAGADVKLNATLVSNVSRYVSLLMAVQSAVGQSSCCAFAHFAQT